MYYVLTYYNIYETYWLDHSKYGTYSSFINYYGDAADVITRYGKFPYTTGRMSSLRYVND